MRKMIMALCAIMFSFLVGCGEETYGERLVILNLPDPPDIVVTTTTPAGQPQPTTPCNGACGDGTRCDAAMNACVAVEMPETPDPLLERCPEWDYRATKLARPADEPIELARGDRGLLFGVNLEGCNAEQVERLAVRAPGFEAFAVLQLMNDGRRRTVGTSEVTNVAGIALMALDDVRVGIGVKISLLVYGAPSTTTSTGPSNIELYAVHARRIEDDGIARLSAGPIAEIIQILENTPPAQVTISRDASSPRQQLFAAGSLGATLGIINLLATGGGILPVTVSLQQRTTSGLASSFTVANLLYLTD